MNRLVYANNKWCLTVNGEQVPNSKIINDSLKMAYDEYPSVEILLDQIDIVGLDVVEVEDEK